MRSPSSSSDSALRVSGWSMAMVATPPRPPRSAGSRRSRRAPLCRTGRAPATATAQRLTRTDAFVHAGEADGGGSARERAADLRTLRTGFISDRPWVRIARASATAGATSEMGSARFPGEEVHAHAKVRPRGCRRRGPCGVGRATPAAAAGTKLTEPLNQYVVSGKVNPEDLARKGFDLTEAQVKGKPGFAIVATPSQAADLAGKDVTVRPLARDATTAKVAAPSPLTDPTHGYDVFRPWSLKPAPCPSTCATPLVPLKDFYDDLARRNPDVVKEYVYGKSVLGQDLVAYKVTKNARNEQTGSRARRVLRVHAARARVDRRRGRAPPLRVRPRRTRTRRAASTSRASWARSELWFVPIVEPRRLRLHLHRARPPACGARTCATTTATAPSPTSTASTPTATGPRSGTTTSRARPTTRPRRPSTASGPASEPEVKALRSLDQEGRPGLPHRLPLVRPADPLPRGLAGRDAVDRRAADGVARRRRRQPGRAGLRPRRLGGALHDQRRRDRRRVPHVRHAGLHGRARRRHRAGGRRHGRQRSERLHAWRLRLPGQRGRHRGRGEEEPRLRPRPGAARPTIRRTSSRTWATPRPTSCRRRSRSPTAIRRRWRSTPSASSAP